MAYVNVAEWKPEQVTEWLKGLDNSILSYVHSFLNNEVNGQQLLNIRPDDLDHLGVQKIGHQELILEAVENLRNFHYELDRENLQLLALRLSCRARSLHKELLYQEDSEPVNTQTLADVASIITTVKPIACWLGRSPFTGHSDYHHRKMELLNLSLEIATCANRGRFAERPVEEIRRSCDKLACLADNIIQDINDPLLLQPASLDLASVKKRAGDDLGFFIQPSFHGIHQISELKFNSPAQQCGKIEEGDEIVQVNYQTVVGWQSKKVMFLLEESRTDVFLTLKKRPRHTKVYGQIYIKPYRLPSKKRATPYILWHENLPSPRPELLTIPDFEIPLPRSLPKQGVIQPEVVHLSDSEPLAGSSSSGDDEDDGAFLPGIVDLSQASPTSMRLYLPKQRSSVQRRATVTGASPTSCRAPVNIDQLWRELQIHHQWRGSGQNPSSIINSESCEIRDKSHCISSSLMSVNDVLRPTTCLGIEQSMKNSFRVRKSKPMTENNFILRDDETSKKEDKRCAENISIEDLPFTKEKNINTKFEKSLKSCDKIDSSIFQNVPSHLKDNSSCCLKGNCKNNCRESVEKYSLGESVPVSASSINKMCSTEKKSDCFVDSSFSYLQEKSKEKVHTSVVLISEHNTAPSMESSKLETPQNYPIDENALKIPFGKMKYIDDTSDTNLNKEFSDEYDTQTSLEDADLNLRTLPRQNETHLRHKHSDGLNTFPGNSLNRKYNSESESDSKTKIAHSSDIIVPRIFLNEHISQESFKEDFMPSQASLGDARTCNNEQHTDKLCNKISEGPKTNFINPLTIEKGKVEPRKIQTSCAASNIRDTHLNSISNFSYRNKLAQSLGHLGNNRPAPLICSPKTLKRRNLLLAKRRNVNLKDLGQADFEGWLLHRCRWSATGASLGTTWTRTWFVLKGAIFYGFKSPHASKANIMIYLPGFTASVADEVKSKKFAFKVYHTGTVFYFAAESEQLLLQWLQSISLGTIVQDSGRALCSEDAFFSETDDDLDQETTKDTGTCFSNPKTYKFSNFLGGNSSPVASRSQQNLASESKMSHEKEKKFGSLKKLGRKVTDGNCSHSEGGNSSSLDRKYLCFLGSSRNSTVPVPTAHFRSYRRAPNSSPHKILLESTRKKEPASKCTNIGACSNRFIDISKEHPRKAYGVGSISEESSGTQPQSQDKVRHLCYSNKSKSPNFDSPIIKETSVILTKVPVSDRLLRPVKTGDLRDQSTHSSNPTLQHSGDLSDYRLAAERLRQFNVQRNRQREDTSGFVTLEEFMLSRQEEERKSEALCRKVSNEKSEVYQSIDFKHKGNESIGHDSINSSKSSGHLKKENNDSKPSAIEGSGEGRNPNPHWISNNLKSVAQYQPPPVAQLDDSQPLTMAFEMHLGEKDTSNSKASKFLNIFSSKCHRQNSQKQNNLEISTRSTTDPRQKTLLGSPRLHRALFRDKHHMSSSKGSSSDSNSNSSSISSPVFPFLSSPNEWAMESAETNNSQTKPTMGISMLGKRPVRRSPATYTQTTPPPMPASTPDYPGLEYPPVFEPETYTLADASSLRSRPRAQAEKNNT